MAEEPQRIEAAYWGAERDEHSSVPVGGERQAPVGDRESRWPRGLQEGVRPGHRYIGDVRQRCGDAPRTEMGIELPVAHIHEGGRRTDAERASRQAIRPREAKGETLDVTHRSDATEGVRHVDLRSRVSGGECATLGSGVGKSARRTRRISSRRVAPNRTTASEEESQTAAVPTGWPACAGTRCSANHRDRDGYWKKQEGATSVVLTLSEALRPALTTVRRDHGRDHASQERPSGP